jgi:hypothetical protein
MLEAHLKSSPAAAFVKLVKLSMAHKFTPTIIDVSGNVTDLGKLVVSR